MTGRRGSWFLLPACLLAAPYPVQAQDLVTRVLRAGDARPGTVAALAPLREGLGAADSLARRLAVRALGRLERGELLSEIAPLLGDPAATVRAEAANAMAQAAGPEGAGRARHALEDRLSGEPDPRVRGVLFRSLGRLQLSGDEATAQVETLLLQGSRGPAEDAAPPVLEGVTHGLGSLYRRTAARRAPSVRAIRRLFELSRAPHPAQVRLQAMDALVATRRADSLALLAALADPEWQVRRLALVAARTQTELPGRERIIRRAWDDPAAGVRYEALRAFGRHLLARDGCRVLFPRLEDSDPHVRLQAIDLLADCGPAATSILRRIARDTLAPFAWHEPAHALLALARVAPASFDTLAPRFLAAGLWWPRVYLARAADRAGRAALLERLARDPEPNVRTAALAGLRRHLGHAADSLYRAALSSEDYELLLTAVQALDSTPSPGTAIQPLLDALHRITATRRETSRDPRVAILELVGRLADSTRAPELLPYLRDFDPVVAGKAAAVLETWTGRTAVPRPQPDSSATLPGIRTLEGMAALRATLVLRGGRRVQLRLLALEAPGNVARFVRLARAGWFEGLSFHRVVPGFVVQGGSPGANEHMGDGPYTRDELGLVSNRRGTVGLSTRGRDTGDGQLFINLVDNLRLDHEYTVFALVEAGMEHVDLMLEGEPILRVELTQRGTP